MVTVNVITRDVHTITVAEQGLAGMEIEKSRVRTALNQVSGCTLNIPSSNKASRILTSGIDHIIEVVNDNRRVFYGSVESVKENLFGGLEVECDGAVSWLANVVKQPFQVTNRTHADYIETILSQHRTAMIEAGTAMKSILFGGVVGFSGNVDIHHSDEYMNTLELLKECVEKYGGYFFETFGGTAGSPSVGWMKEPTISSGQVIEFGVNIASLETMLDFSEYASRVYAINGDGLTVTGGYVVDADAESVYGRKDYGYKSQAETQAELDAEAAAILAVKKVPIRSIEATATMLERAGCNINAMKLGTTVEAIDRRLGANLTLMVNSIDRDYVNPLDGTIVLGRSNKTLTQSIKG